MALPNYRTQLVSIQLETIIQGDGEQFDLGLPYQRDYVWDPVRNVAFLKSLLMGVPTGTFVVNDRRGEDTAHYAVIDGKQRIAAILAFVYYQLTVPREWFADDDLNYDALTLSRVSYEHLSRQGQSKFRNIPVSMAIVPLTDEEGEAQLHVVMHNGLALGQQDPN